MSSTLEASVFMEKNYKEHLHSIRNTGNNLTLNTPISWENYPWKQLSLVNCEEVISLSHAKVYVFSDSVLCLGKDDSEPNIKYCLGTTVGLVQRFITIQNFVRKFDGESMEFEWNISQYSLHCSSSKKSNSS